MRKHTISVLVENQFGVLAKVAGMFSARGYNIESLSVAETLDPTISRMTIVTRGDDQIIEQITKHLNKLVPVIKVSDLTGTAHIDREMALIKVEAKEKNRAEILRIAEIFRGKILDVSPTSFVIEVTGDDEKIAAFIALLKPLGIKEVGRSGKVAMGRGSKTTD
ncbi:MAG: acetolactate synthase small subunit [Proteobacteria bacterium]|nr:acetolactate synthase small subunit [Pseudomonadota bacterium]